MENSQPNKSTAIELLAKLDTTLLAWLVFLALGGGDHILLLRPYSLFAGHRMEPQGSVNSTPNFASRELNRSFTLHNDPGTVFLRNRPNRLTSAR